MTKEEWEKKSVKCPCHYNTDDFCMALERFCEYEICPFVYWMKASAEPKPKVLENLRW